MSLFLIMSIISQISCEKISVVWCQYTMQQFLQWPLCLMQCVLQLLLQMWLQVSQLTKLCTILPPGHVSHGHQAAEAPVLWLPMLQELLQLSRGKCCTRLLSRVTWAAWHSILWWLPVFDMQVQCGRPRVWLSSVLLSCCQVKIFKLLLII